MRQSSILSPCNSYARMVEDWDLVRDLLGGTRAMREAGTRWLPQEPAEEAIDYNTRLRRSVLFGGLASAIRKVAARPFAREAVVRNVEKLSPTMEGFLRDVDMQGTTLTQFGRTLYDDAAAYGLTHLLVDWHSSDVAANRRPFWTHIPALSLIWWRFDGKRLTEVRIQGTVEEDDPKDPWSRVERQTVRRYWVEDGRVWTELHIIRGENEAPEVTDPVEMTDSRGGPLPEIPIVSIGFNLTAPMEASPPFMGCAWANLEHWQSLSDQRNILRFARIPMLAMTGIRDEEDDEESVHGDKRISVRRVLVSGNPDAKFYFVEPAGAAIEAGRLDLQAIEERMERLGAQPNARRIGTQTATGQSIDEQSTEGQMAAWSRAIESGLTLGLWWAEAWLGNDLPDDVTVNLADDRSMTAGRDQRAKLLLSMEVQGLLRKVTALREAQIAGIVSEDVDPETEVELAAQERAALPGELDPGDDEDEDDVSGQEPADVARGTQGGGEDGERQ